MIVTVLVCGYLDSQRLLNRFFYPMITLGISTEKMEKENVFDLNAICTAGIDNRYVFQLLFACLIKKVNQKLLFLNL